MKDEFTIAKNSQVTEQEASVMLKITDYLEIARAFVIDKVTLHGSSGFTFKQVIVKVIGDYNNLLRNENRHNS